MISMSSGQLTNPEVLEFAARVFDVCQIALKRGARTALGVPGTRVPAGSIVQVAADAFGKTLGRNRQAVRDIAGQSRSLRAPFVPLRGAGAAAVLAFDSNKDVFDQAVAAGQFDGLTLRDTIRQLAAGNAAELPHVAELLGQQVQFRSATSAAAPSTDASAKKAKKLRLEFVKAKAVRRYGWEPTDWGPDNMYTGGISQDSQAEPYVWKTPPTKFGTFSRDGQVRDFKDIVFAEFPLTGDRWPRVFTATPFIAESDGSGAFLDFLQEVWEKIAPKVEEIAAKLAAAAVAGGLAGAAAGSVAGVVGAIVGAVVGAVLVALVTALLDSWEDDIFTIPGAIRIQLDSVSHTFDGALVSPRERATFTKGNALYTIDYHWRLVQ